MILQKVYINIHMTWGISTIVAENNTKIIRRIYYPPV